ncbi:DUF3040 domain-containing protein [Actinocrispum sp. NPDC049592]|uniref:DUF3040 domain-containing protein n=1 Tax=Actinocrispum sp. NPDC049592 TaxID=3154835 RepID=UPI003447709F
MLNAHEQQQLRLIARGLEADDPALAQSLSGRRTPKRSVHWASVVLAMLAVVLAVLTVVTEVLPLFLLACVAAIAAAWAGCLTS